tara:strand:+ start:733354 stop:734751 length:1398 start_codon:yes stop_codon:yes gene_type:complete
MTLSRRKLLIAGGVAGATLSARSWTSLVRGEVPSNRIRVGVIGTGVRGKYLIGNLPDSARIEAICDCATSRMGETLKPKAEFKDVLADFASKQARHCSTHHDYRQMIDQTKLDAVIIATPDHHHVQAAMLALEAGLDVYLEKPLSLTIREGRLLSDAVRKTGRILQVGSQQRSMEANRFACEFIRDGGLGKITRVDVPNYPGPMSIPDFPKQPVPGGLHWDLFLGAARKRPHHRQLWIKDDFKVGDLLWRGWDLFRDYSGHLMTNWGGHNLDMVQYALGMDESGPVKVEPLRDVSEAALLQDWKKKWHKKTPKPDGAFSDDSRFAPIRMTYPGGIEMNFLPDVPTATFYGERGRMTIARNKFKCDPANLIDDAPTASESERWDGSGHVARPHLQNWLDCIRSRSTPNAPVEVGHRSATVCHLANIARDLNRPLVWHPDSEQFDDADANELLDRPRREGFRLPHVS